MGPLLIFWSRLVAKRLNAITRLREQPPDYRSVQYSLSIHLSQLLDLLFPQIPVYNCVYGCMLTMRSISLSLSNYRSIILYMDTGC
mmetsp:Transcript_1199/g.2498  ORF Transcript_1199/g.2498 Transcript_1199/m.2498 type:complete len:86 (-) Transcript_1199:34-291(-)